MVEQAVSPRGFPAGKANFHNKTDAVPSLLCQIVLSAVGYVTDFCQQYNNILAKVACTTTPLG